MDHCTHQPRFQALTSILPDTGQVATWPAFVRFFWLVEHGGTARCGFSRPSPEGMRSSELRKDEEPKIVTQLC